MVDVFEAQQKPPAGLTRRAPASERRANMPEMKIPGRARREPGDDVGSAVFRQLGSAGEMKNPSRGLSLDP
jgi:hypothetical protein